MLLYLIDHNALTYMLYLLYNVAILSYLPLNPVVQPLPTFYSVSGVRQGGVLLLALFSVYLHNLDVC